MGKNRHLPTPAGDIQFNFGERFESSVQWPKQTE